MTGSTYLRSVALVVVCVVVAAACQIRTVAGGGTSPIVDGADALTVDLGTGPLGIDHDAGITVFSVENQVLSMNELGILGIEHAAATPVGMPARLGQNTYAPVPAANHIVRVGPNPVTISTGGDVPVAVAAGASGRVFVGLDTGEVRELVGTTLVALPGTPTLTLVDAGGLRGFDIDGADRIVGTLGNQVIRYATSGAGTVLAGAAGPGFAGDGGAAAAALLNNPTDASVAAGGTIYIADRGNERVREIAPDGIITTVAGNGQAGFGGELGEATDARLDGARGVSALPLGEFAIADTGNARVRLVGGNAQPDRFVALGDSYTAGTGTDNYLPGAVDNACQRSSQSYGPLIAGTGSVPADLTFGACVSAVTEDLLSSQLPGQDAQLNFLAPAGEADPTIKVITATIGGNDLHPDGLSGLLVPCISILGVGGDCEAELAPGVSASFDALLNGSPTQLPVVDYLDEMLNRAPEAHVYLVGYPHLFSSNAADYSGGSCSLLLFGLVSVDLADALFINDLVDTGYDLLESARTASADPSRITIVDVRGTFDGREACTSNPLLNEVVLAGSNFVGESFHPNPAGYAAVANQLTGIIG